MKNVLDSKDFWKTMRPFLSDKNIVLSQISIEKNSRIISDDFDLSEKFSTFFEDAVRSLNVKPYEYYLLLLPYEYYRLLLGTLKTIEVFKLLSKIFQ